MPSYWPYEELRFAPGPGDGEYHFRTPWAHGRIEVPVALRGRVEAVISEINSGPGPGAIPELSWLLELLQDYPVSYRLPRAGCRPPGPPTGPWDVASALSFSRCAEDAYDPSSLLTIGRRAHLIGAIAMDATAELYAAVKELTDLDRARQACALIVRQNHYVTENCERALAPALAIAGDACREIEKFMAAERGHDAILAFSLNKLGYADPAALSPVPAAVALMDAFRAVAGRNLLAFAIVVDMFERNSYQETDPLAALLESKGFAEAARPIQRHKQINDSGAHENVSLAMLAAMPPVTADYVGEAFRLAEGASRLMNGYSRDILKGVRLLFDARRVKAT